MVFFACGDQDTESYQKKSEHQPDSIAVNLNNKAVGFMSDAAHTYDSLRGYLYDSALFYLNKSLEVDSLYLTAYSNKSQVLRSKGQLGQSLEILKKIESIKPGFAEVIMEQGFTLEKMGKTKSAINKYNQALEAYKIRLEETSDPVKVKMDMAFVYIFLEGKNKGLDELQYLILEYPDNERLKAMEGYFEGFNREEFIKSY